MTFETKVPTLPFSMQQSHLKGRYTGLCPWSENICLQCRSWHLFSHLKDYELIFINKFVNFWYEMEIARKRQKEIAHENTSRND